MLIDIGTTYKLYYNKPWGDVNTLDIVNLASGYTPVPGGIGPMTVSMVCWNTIRSYLEGNSMRGNDYYSLKL